jgi:hypothetical protein
VGDTPIIDAATDCFQLSLDSDGRNFNAETASRIVRDCIVGAFRIALPQEPSPAWLEAMAKACWDKNNDECDDPWLGLDQVTKRCCYDEAYAAYRAQPLWLELWGGKNQG